MPVTSTFYTVVGGNALGLPVGIWALIVIVIGLTVVVLRLSRFGVPGAVDRVQPAGGLAQRGISCCRRMRVTALILMGVLSGRGRHARARGTPPPGYLQLGTGFELEVIAAAVIGGAHPAGRR